MSRPISRTFQRGALLVALAPVLWMLSGCGGGDQKERAKDLESIGYEMTSDSWTLAASNNDVAVLGRFLKEAWKLEDRDSAGLTALHAAAAADSLDAAKLLLDAGANLDARDRTEMTPLMHATRNDHPRMTAFLLKRGADPTAQDADHFTPMMVAIRDGANRSLAVLAPYSRPQLDSGILLASLLGNAGAIDELSAYGASVYARMEDGRSVLMVAAQNGNLEAVQMLLDLGASRFATDEAGRTAADYAVETGHPQLAAVILAEPTQQDLTLDSDERIAAEMAALADVPKISELTPGGEFPGGFDDADAMDIDEALGMVDPEASFGGEPTQTPATRAGGAVAGARVGGAHARRHPRPLQDAVVGSRSAAAENHASFPPAAGDPAPPLIVRSFRQRELPLRISPDSPTTALVTLQTMPPREFVVSPGDEIPGSRLRVDSLSTRLEEIKDSSGPQQEILIMRITDLDTGEVREWSSVSAPKAHDPVALVEDPASGDLYLASVGQTFHTADGKELRVVDVRPSQLVIEEPRTGITSTLRLSGMLGNP